MYLKCHWSRFLNNIERVIVWFMCIKYYIKWVVIGLNISGCNWGYVYKSPSIRNPRRFIGKSIWRMNELSLNPFGFSIS